MTNISVTEAQLKTASSRLVKAVKARSDEGKSVSHAWMLEALSQAFWQKPYGEIKATILDNNPKESKGDPSLNNKAGRVHILEYGNEEILVLDREYVTGNFPGTDLEVPSDFIDKQAETLAGSHGSFVKRVILPEVLPEDYETDDIINLADRLGYFQYRQPFIEAIDDCLEMYLNGDSCGFGLDDGFEGSFQWELQTTDFEELMEEHPVWMPEVFHAAVLHEYFFSLNDLGRAKEISPGHWALGKDQEGNIAYVQFTFRKP
jgi:hypothetical protein